MKKTFLTLFLFTASAAVFAQDAVNYQQPPKAIADLLLAKPIPSVSIDGKAEWMLLSTPYSYPSVEELARPEFRIAGLRINPDNFSPSRKTFISSFALKNIKTGKTATITGLPSPLFAADTTWNPGQNKISFLHKQLQKVLIYIS
ncbi:hypothetical protein [Pedobacter sp. NJ-S-72]